MDNGNMRSASGEAFEKKEIFFIFVLLFLCYLLFFFHLGARPLWDGDEGMHATTSKEMVLSGDWITPSFNGEKFYDKPVLYNWFVSLSFLVFGFTEFAARLPSAILGTGCVMVVYLLGRTLFGPMVGFLSGVILATSGEHLILSRVVVHDIALVFFITLSLFFFYIGFKEGGRRKSYILLFYASSGFAVLAKGPVGVLLPFLIIGLFLLLQRRLTFLKELWSLWGILLFFAIAAPWYVLISLKNRDYLSYFILHQNVMRFLSSKTIHQEPFYYYFPLLLGGFLPWSFFLPVVLIRGIQGLFKKKDERVVFLVTWFLVIFLFFSAASSKLPTYLLPLFPSISLLAGVLWHDLLRGVEPRLWKGSLYSLLPFWGTLLLGLIYLWIKPPSEFEIEYGLNPANLRFLILLPLLGLASFFFLFLRRGLRASFLVLIATVVSVILFLNLAIIPAVNSYRSTKRLALEIDKMLEPGEKVVFGRFLRHSALFYTNRRALVLNNYQELMGFLDSPKRVYCILKKSSYEDLKGVKERAYVIDQEGNRLIVSNRK